MSDEAVERALGRVVARRPDLALAAQVAADGLTCGEGVGLVHQAVLQRFLWWRMPRDCPAREWDDLVESTGALLHELRLSHLAHVARSAETRRVLEAWRVGPFEGMAAFQEAHARSGVEPPDTELLEWGSVMGIDEARAYDAVERALGDAVAAGELVPGAARWRTKAVAISEAVLGRPLDLPPGQTLASLVTTERVATWIEGARHGTHRAWRSSVANRLLHPVELPPDPARAVEPMRWLLAAASGPDGTALTQAGYLARATVLAAVERFGWWDWHTPPHSEAEVAALSTLREVASRLRLVRRRGRRLLLTARGATLLARPEALWVQLARTTEDGSEFTAMVTELVGLRLLAGRVEVRQLVADLHPILEAQGWSTPVGPITADHVLSAIYRPVRWWQLFDLLDEEEATWERGTARELTPHTVALTADGERTVLAYLRARAAGPRRRLWGD